MIGIPVQNSEKLPQLILLPQLHPPGKEILISVLLPSPKTDGLGQLPGGWNIPKPCGLCPEGWPAEDGAGNACWGPAVVNKWSCYETQKDHRYRCLKYNFKHVDDKNDRDLPKLIKRSMFIKYIECIIFVIEASPCNVEYTCASFQFIFRSRRTIRSWCSYTWPSRCTTVGQPKGWIRFRLSFVCIRKETSNNHL